MKDIMLSETKKADVVCRLCPLAVSRSNVKVWPLPQEQDFIPLPKTLTVWCKVFDKNLRAAAVFARKWRVTWLKLSLNSLWPLCLSLSSVSVSLSPCSLSLSHSLSSQLSFFPRHIYRLTLLLRCIDSISKHFYTVAFVTMKMCV